MFDFEPAGRDVEWTGRIISTGTAKFRHPDGEVVLRDAVWHPGAVGVLAVGEDHVWLTHQPREVSGMIDSLEIPAGKLDKPGEPPVEAAKRELVEEVGVKAAHWELLYEFFTSPGFCDEKIWIFLATDLSELDGGAQPDEGERIAAEKWSLDRIDEAIGACRDSKSLIALLHLARLRS